eukprot:scaffold19546_cov65-Cyclotella_meneghiniana.AAC.3
MTELRYRRSSSIPQLKHSSTADFCNDDGSNPRDDEVNPLLLHGNMTNFFRFNSLFYTSTQWRNDQMMMHNEKESNIIEHFGSEVAFSSQFHYTTCELDPYRFTGDVEMDELLDYLSTSKQGGCGAFDDVIRFCEEQYVIQQAAGECNHVQDTNIQHPPAVKFYQHYHQIPPWVDWSQIQRGINIFLAYLPASGCALYYRSLVGGFSIPKIVEVLIATRYLVPASMRRGVNGEVINNGVRNESSSDDRKRTFERLLDTGGFMACCFAPTDPEAVPAASLRPGGKGWKAALHVRVLHAKVRRSLLKSNSWDMKNGVPINQEDLAATLLAFSVNVLLGIEFVAGRPLSESDQRDYLALWRYLGWLLGVDTPEEVVERTRLEGRLKSSNPNMETLYPLDPCGPYKFLDGQQSCYGDSIIHSHATLESMILHLLHPTKESCQLVHHLLSFNGKVRFRSEMCRQFLGQPLSDSLGIPNCTDAMIALMVYFFLMTIRCYTNLAMTFPWLRQTMIRWHGALQKRFLVIWEVNHNKRVGAAVGEKKSCPFSMLMPPAGGAF